MKYIAEYWKLRADGTRIKQVALNLKADTIYDTYKLAHKIMYVSRGDLRLIGITPEEFYNVKVEPGKGAL